jgi:hypothetical protein
MTREERDELRRLADGAWKEARFPTVHPARLVALLDALDTAERDLEDLKAADWLPFSVRESITSPAEWRNRSEAFLKSLQDRADTAERERDGARAWAGRWKYAATLHAGREDAQRARALAAERERDEARAKIEVYAKALSDAEKGREIFRAQCESECDRAEAAEAGERKMMSLLLAPEGSPRLESFRADVRQLKEQRDEARAAVAALVDDCRRLEADREYNAGLVATARREALEEAARVVIARASPYDRSRLAAAVRSLGEPTPDNSPPVMTAEPGSLSQPSTVQAPANSGTNSAHVDAIDTSAERVEKTPERKDEPAGALRGKGETP